jgi:AmmeMemoRadiSam system protein A
MSLDELSDADRAGLLEVARAALEAEVREEAEPAFPDRLSAPLRRRREGAFVSVHRGDELRGCVGYVEPHWPLVETVARAARSVTRDRRFPPLAAVELPEVAVEISVLSVPAVIRGEDVEIGVHGLVLECDGTTGLLLPQVAIAHGWDGETYLDQLCRKAGLPPGTWRRADARLLAFTAQVFGEIA